MPGGQWAKLLGPAAKVVLSAINDRDDASIRGRGALKYVISYIKDEYILVSFDSVDDLTVHHGITPKNKSVRFRFRLNMIIVRH